MDKADVNGGNAEVAQEQPNLENVASSKAPTTAATTATEMTDAREEATETPVVKVEVEEQEVNGEVKSATKKGATPAARRKLRKFKANSTSTIESGPRPKTRGRKRKLSERDELSSEESMEFNGFDVQGTDNLEPGSNVLKKLIAEAESAESLHTKRFKLSTSRTGSKILDQENEGKAFDEKDDDPESDDSKMQIDESSRPFDGIKIKKEKDSDKSETDSIGGVNSLESENEQLKAEDSSAKSPNSSANSSPSASSQKSKNSRISRGGSPGSALKQKIAVDMSNPAFKEPFKYGWKRELVYRAGTENNVKRMADIYYYTPKGKKVRSFREVAEFLNTKELTIDNFTFFKEPIGLDDPEKEVIRDAKRVRDSGPVTPVTVKKPPVKKAMPVRKVVEEPPPPPPKAVSKSTKLASGGFKVKLPAKKTSVKVEPKSPTNESEMLPPQWNSPAATRRSQTVAEKPPTAKTKRVLKTKVQEPCSIRCSTSMGLIPSLQCCVCLCLYHPECVDGVEFADGDDYVCKNCQQDSDDTDYQQHREAMSPSLTPPPLIPISLLGTQNPKSKHQMNSTPPKLQRIPKSDSSDAPPRTSSKASRTASTPKSTQAEKKEVGTWYTHARNEYFHTHDGTMPRPAQNIALMAGKKYIVVPKNNSMAVQPAITVKSDRIGDKPPLLRDNLLTDGSKTVEESKTPHLLTNSVKDMNNTDKPELDLPEVSAPVVASTDQSCDFSAETELRRANTTPVTDSFIGTDKSANNEPEKNQARRESLVMTAGSSVLTKSSAIDVEPVGTRSQGKLTGSESALTGDKKKPLVPLEVDQRQHFWVSVCAGYHALSRVFQYLKVQELLRAARVCKMWRDLAAHPALWKTVRMKNSQVTDWEGLADSLKRHGTQHLDLRKMLVAGEFDGIWKKFVTVIPRVTSLVKLELCRCPVTVVEEVIKGCPQLEVLSAMSIKCESLSLESVGNMKHCQELRLKTISGMSLQGDLTPLKELSQLAHLSLTSVKDLGKKKIEIIESLTNLESLELGECSDFPDKFGTTVLQKLQKLERLRLEKGQGSCCTFDILEGVSKMENLAQVELVNFDVKNGFDKYLANCKNIKKLLIIPTYISQSATSNNMVLGGVTELSNNLTHFVWGVTLELLRVTELFVDQCNQMSKQVTGDSIPVLKPVPCLKLIEDVQDNSDSQKGDDKQQPNLTNPQVDILPLPQLQKLLLTALPKTRVKILKIPFHATWRQSISDSTGA